jgi:hypothetical protein
MNVRFSNPNETIDRGTLSIPTTMQELVKQHPDLQEDLKKNPGKEAEYLRGYRKAMQ